MTAPLISPDVDLRDFNFMPLKLNLLFNSDTWRKAKRVPFAAYALVNLWGTSWHQVPAGSLPDDEDDLRDMAGVSDWESVREIALRGFIKCDDGRLYHPIICEEAKKAWRERQRFRKAAKMRWKKTKPRHATHEQRISDASTTDHATHMQETGTGTGTGTVNKKTPPHADARGVPALKDFDRFWAAVPKEKRVDKGHAEKAWKSAIRAGADPEQIIAAMQNYAAAVGGMELRFIPKPSTWLNGKRWLDNADSAVASEPFDQASADAAAIKIIAGKKGRPGRVPNFWGSSMMIGLVQRNQITVEAALALEWADENHRSDFEDAFARYLRLPQGSKASHQNPCDGVTDETPEIQARAQDGGEL